jgi:perosamine synthetase
LIPISKPWMGEEEANAARRPILSGWVIQGPEVAAFESEFARYTGAPHACAVSSGTASLHLALMALGIGPGDEVITVSHSFIATANVVRYCGAVPVFVDIEPGTFNMNPALIEAAITERTRAILCVHQIGMPCDLAAILKIARAHALPVVEDAACAIGSEILWNGTWEKIGRPHADIACFSFHPRKLVSTGDGGMITTANSTYDQHVRLHRQHGMSVPGAARHGAKEVIFESYPVLGYNYRLSDIQAAVGREQLKRLPAMIERRRYQAARYRELLRGVTLPVEPEWARSNWQSYCVRLPDGIDQRAVMQSMLDAGVSTKRGVMCAHTEPAYRDGPWSQADLPESERALNRCLLLPMFHQMTDQDQDCVVQALAAALA